MIGLAGITSSFAALAWSRRREFGVLRFLGLKRGEILRLLALEGVATGALGAAIGLVSGIAMSLVLVRVVNRQSFHWNLEVHWPVATLGDPHGGHRGALRRAVRAQVPPSRCATRRSAR